MPILEVTPADIALLIGAAGAFIASLLGSFGALVVSLSNGKKLNDAVGKTAEIHTAVNSNLDKLRLQFYLVSALLGAGVVWTIYDRDNRAKGR